MSSIIPGSGLGSGESAAEPSPAVADIGITRCDRLATDESDPDRVHSLAHVQWDDLDPAAAIIACEQALLEHPGHRRLQAQLARAYLAAYRYDDAYAVANEAASAGSLHALYQQAEVYRVGKKDDDKAIKTFERAADAGHAGAMTALGWRLYVRDGWGDRGKARSWFQKAAAAGNVWGMASLANMYIVPDKEFGKAFPWYQRAAEQGNAVAQHMIGLYYARGLPPVDKNPDQALQYFERAAKNGYAGAGVNAAWLYIKSPYSGGAVKTPILESDRKDKALYWLEYSMPKLSVR